MIASRLSSILLFVLSLGFLVCAAPSSPVSRALAHRRDVGKCPELTALEGMTRKQLDSCFKVKTIEEAKPIIDTLVNNIKSTTESLVKTGKIETTEATKTDIAVRCASIISLICKMFLKLCQNLGHDAIVSLFAPVCAALKDMISALNSCVPDILSLVCKKIADVKTEAVLMNNFADCAKLLGLA